METYVLNPVKSADNLNKKRIKLQKINKIKIKIENNSKFMSFYHLSY